jgi:hypothetical protein
MSGARYIVKLANGKYLGIGGREVSQCDAFRYIRRNAWMDATGDGSTVLRLKPSTRAAELAKLRAQVTCLSERCAVYQDDIIDAERKLDAMTKEREALAAQLAALPPDVTDWEVAKAIHDAVPSTHEMAKAARRLLRGTAAPVRPVEELAEELRNVWSANHGSLDAVVIWGAVARRARELGAR